MSKETTPKITDSQKEAIYLILNYVSEESTSFSLSFNGAGNVSMGTHSFTKDIIGSMMEVLEGVITNEKQLSSIKNIVRERILDRSDRHHRIIQSFLDQLIGGKPTMYCDDKKIEEILKKLSE